MAAIGEFLNPTITRLELFANAQPIGVATGFFLKYENQWYLVSNWHVLSGRNPSNGQSMHPNLAVPDKCVYVISALQGEQLAFHGIQVDLGSIDDNSATWYQHPTMGQDCDIGCLPLHNNPVGFARDLLDPTGHDPDMFIELGHELFLPGFPLGFSANGIMAIWKRASLASSLESGHGVSKYFYVDTASRSGMSGAPCLAISNWQHYRLSRPTGKMQVINSPLSHRLLGVYSGRHNPSDGFEAQIGIVWRETLIFDILRAKTLASVKLRSSSSSS